MHYGERAQRHVLDFLDLWNGDVVTARLAIKDVPTELTFRGELLRDSPDENEPPPGFAGWFLVVRTTEMQLSGIGTLELYLERYPMCAVELRELGAAALMLTAPGGTLTLERAVDAEP